MTELQGLIETDRLATLSVNGSGSLFWDGVADIYTSVYIWIPVAFIAILLILRNINSKQILFVLLMIALTILCCDQLASSVFKPLFHRLRPTRDPFILDMIDTVNGYRGGLYGFFSSHAANSFGIAVLFMWLVRDLKFGLSVGIWAALNSMIRTYLGVHFVGDILTGAIVGTLVASIIYGIYTALSKNSHKKVSHNSNLLYTPSGFMKTDISVFLCFLYGTFSVILMGSCITQSFIL